MSINYHAYQCRNFKFDDYEKIALQWREAFTGFDPERAARILDLIQEEGRLYIPYFGTPYRLRLQDGVLEKKTGEEWTDDLWFNEALVIYHILNDVADEPRQAGEMIPNTELDPAARGNSRQEDILFSDFSRKASGRTEQLKKACLANGGIAFPSKADAAFLFRPFPQIPLQLLFWDEDEDFPAKVQVLVDRYVTDYLHPESTGCLISDLFEMLSPKLADE